MDVGPALVADRETPKAVKSGERPLHDPAVPTQSLAALHSPSGYLRLDATPTREMPAARAVVALVGVKLPGTFARPPGALLHGLDRIHHLFEQLRVVDVGGGDGGGEEYAPPIDEEVVLGARPAAVYGVGAGLLAPPLGRNARRIQRSSRPVNAVRAPEPVPQDSSLTRLLTIMQIRHSFELLRSVRSFRGRRPSSENSLKVYGELSTGRPASTQSCLPPAYSWTLV